MTFLCIFTVIYETLHGTYLYKDTLLTEVYKKKDWPSYKKLTVPLNLLEAPVF